MSDNIKKFLDTEGVKHLWSKLSMQDYPNNETLIAVINAIDDSKADKSEIKQSDWNQSDDSQSDYIKNKPQEQINKAELFATLALPGTLKWNGHIENKTHSVFSEDENFVKAIVHLYDEEFMHQSIISGVSKKVIGLVNIGGETFQVNFSQLASYEDGFSVWTDLDFESNDFQAIVVYIPHDNYTVELEGISILFEKRGLYSVADYYKVNDIKVPINYMSVLSIEGYSFKNEDEIKQCFEQIKELNTTHVQNTLTWDGSVKDKIVVHSPYSTPEEPYYWVKISDSTPRLEQLQSDLNSLSLTYQGTESTYPLNDETFYYDETEEITSVNLNTLTPLLIVHSEQYEAGENFLFPARGIYFCFAGVDDFQLETHSLHIENFDFVVETEIEKTILKEKCLPSTIFETKTTNTIEWDGVIGDKITFGAKLNESSFTYGVHVSDYVPNMDILSQNEVKVQMDMGSLVEQNMMVFEVKEGLYGIGTGDDMPVVIITAYDNMSITFNENDYLIPKAGIYFTKVISDGAPAVFTKSITAATIEAPVVKIKKSALPEDIATEEYVDQKISSIPTPDVSGQISTHNTSDSAHNDIRELISSLTTRINTILDSDDVTLDQMSEVVAYIKSNKSLIESITTNKVNVDDIINNLTTNVTNKPLSAAQGVALKALIDAITVPAKLSDLTDDATHRLVTDTEKAAWNAKSDFSGNYNDLENKPLYNGRYTSLRTYYAKAVDGGTGSFSQGRDSFASGDYSHAEGYRTIASGIASHAEGWDTITSGDYSHAEGENTLTPGRSSHAEGRFSLALGPFSHAEGYGNYYSCTITGEDNALIYTCSIDCKRYLNTIIRYGKTTAEIISVDDTGYIITVSKTLSETAISEETAYIYTSFASGNYSHTEGNSAIASGDYSHAEGNRAIASGIGSHAEGWDTTASGIGSHAEGRDTTASGSYSHAEGESTIASSNYQRVQGKYNIEDDTNTYAHIVGNGTASNNRSNAHTLDWDGSAWFSGDVYVGSTSGKKYDEGSKKLATEEYVQNYVNETILGGEW